MIKIFTYCVDPYDQELDLYRNRLLIDLLEVQLNWRNLLPTYPLSLPQIKESCTLHQSMEY